MTVHTNEAGQRVAQDANQQWRVVNKDGQPTGQFAKGPVLPAPAQAPAPAAVQPAVQPAAQPQVVAQPRASRVGGGLAVAVLLLVAMVFAGLFYYATFYMPRSTTAVDEKVPVVTPAIDYTRYEQVVQQCPTVMEPYAPQKDTLAIMYNAKNEQQFDGVLQDCRNKEATLKYPGPKPTEKDLAMQEKERTLALRVPKCDIGTFSKEKGKCIKQ